MKWKRSVQRYGKTPETETPFQRAGQLWDERIGSARVQARNWRLMAFGCLGLSTAMAGGLLWQSLQSRVVPYVVAVDRLGEARAVSEVKAIYKPTDPQIAWALVHFIENVRGQSLDPVLMRKAWLQAYDFATRRGAAFLNDYARSSGALSQVGARTVSVQVTSVVRASPTSFQVKWIESVYERGNPVGSSHWTAILTLQEKPPRDAETLRKNPLGLYVDAIDWSRELKPAGSSAASRKPAAQVTGEAALPVQIPSNPPILTEEPIP